MEAVGAAEGNSNPCKAEGQQREIQTRPTQYMERKRTLTERLVENFQRALGVFCFIGYLLTACSALSLFSLLSLSAVDSPR